MTKTKKHRSLRDAFGQFATGVTVITARTQAGEPIGITVNSFASVSLEPPLVSWCIDETSTRFEEFLDAQYYSICILNAEQQEISNLFAERSWDNKVFDDVEWFAGLYDVPQIAGASTRFHCKQSDIYAGGDHRIIVGEVLEYDSEPQEPLLFFQGDYRF